MRSCATESGRFALDFEQIKAALSPRTRMIIINSPHNPTGALISRAELDQLAELIRDRDIYLVSDEVYEHLVFDGVPSRQHIGPSGAVSARLRGQLLRQEPIT